MTLRRAYLMVSILGSLLLTGGCAGKLTPDTDSGVIGFGADCSPLQVNVTKGVKDAFATNDYFFVYGAETADATRTAIFDDIQVDKKNSVSWSYTDHTDPVPWNAEATQYDFLGIYGPSDASGITCTPASSNPIMASMRYDSDDQYDLMAACNRRSSVAGVMNTEIVPMEFHHLLSAVSVVVYNDSPEGDVKLYSYHFGNLVIESDVEITQGMSSPSVTWRSDNNEKDNIHHLYEWTSQSGEHDLLLGDYDLLAPGQHSDTGDRWTLLIPQDLNLNLQAPMLTVSYKYGNHVKVDTRINFKIIQTINGDDILEWQGGYKYIYEIHIRYGGGVRVNVITSQWDTEFAGTPGLIIS